MEWIYSTYIMVIKMFLKGVYHMKGHKYYHGDMYFKSNTNLKNHKNSFT